jgi:hypothetical protein
MTTPPEVPVPPLKGSLEELYLEAANGDREHFGPSSESASASTLKAAEVYESIDTSSPEEYRRWIAMFARAPKSKGSNNFVDSIGRTARAELPKFRGYNVSNFCDWVYDLHGVPYSSGALNRGIEGERRVFENRVRPPQRLGWQLIHNGMAVDSRTRITDQTAPRPSSYKISSLSILGEPLSASPDLIFRRQDGPDAKITGVEDILILEIKCTDAPLPLDLWPNLRCQLWAYSKIDQFADAAKLYLAAEVWSAIGTRQRCTVSWRRDDQKYDAECLRLFQAYSSLAKASKLKIPHIHRSGA